MKKTDGMVLESVEDMRTDLYLTFTIGEESYGIDIAYILEIIKLPEITQMPDMPDYINGIINLRGSIIPLMDMRLRLGKVQAEYDDRTCIVVVELESGSIGLIVDSVTEVLTIQEENISRTPEMKSASGRGFVKSIGKVGSDIKLLLDCEKLFNSVELAELSAGF